MALREEILLVYQQSIVSKCCHARRGFIWGSKKIRLLMGWFPDWGDMHKGLTFQLQLSS